ncbi:MAG: 16S rRNA (guanine(966)-N(2))-methyltransferase RsmD [Candidatus Binatia bacterium]
MRVIGGKAKGRRLKAPKGRALRPTGGRVKEALFDILPHDLTGRRVLDLFAGTGALSLEALSRGAPEALLVDFSRAAARAIQENAESLGFSDRSTVWAAPALQAIRRLSRKGESFDLIFLDPPYEKDKVGETLRAVGNAGILRAGGVVVVEHSVREPVARQFGALILTDQRRYGTTVLSFFGARNEPAGVEENKWGEST